MIYTFKTLQIFTVEVFFNILFYALSIILNFDHFNNLLIRKLYEHVRVIYLNAKHAKSLKQILMNLSAIVDKKVNFYT